MNYEILSPGVMKINVGGLKLFGHLVRLLENALAKQALAEARKHHKRISVGQPTTRLSTLKIDFSEMKLNLNEAFQKAYDRNMYTRLVCRAVVRSHQADWRRGRRLKEEMARPEACGRQRTTTSLVCSRSTGLTNSRHDPMFTITFCTCNMHKMDLGMWILYLV